MHIIYVHAMTERIHIVVDRAEKERYRRLAAREGKTLSEWLRAAARDRVARRARDGSTLDMAGTSSAARPVDPASACPG